MLAISLFVIVIFVLMLGYPVAFTLSGVSILFALVCSLTNNFDLSILFALPSRIFGIITNETLVAIPMFIFMGIMLEKSKIAENLLDSMAALFKNIKGGLGISVIIVGALLAASTGIVGATVVTMGLLSLPVMMKQKYNTRIATGTILASGTLGQIIPPSIILIMLGDVISSSYQEAQNMLGVFSQEKCFCRRSICRCDFPGLILVSLYIVYILYIANFRLDLIPDKKLEKVFSAKEVILSLYSPLFLIFIVLGSIILGVATPTEASSFGAIGSAVLALINEKFNLKMLKEVLVKTSKITSMIFILLIGATIFSLVFRGLEGDIFINNALSSLPGDVYTKLAIVMFAIFLLGFILDFIEITYVVIPVVAPILLSMGLDPIWLGILIAINLQTSFLTPPFGFAIFYLKSVIPKDIETIDIYKGVVPFILIQLITIVLIIIAPEITTWLPNKIFG